MKNITVHIVSVRRRDVECRHEPMNEDIATETCEDVRSILGHPMDVYSRS